jgi:hypothetical protein
MKNKFVKNIWKGLKDIIILIIKSDKSLIEDLVKFLFTSWPFRHPEKVLNYIEIFHSVKIEN